MTNIADEIMELDANCGKVVEITRVWRVIYFWALRPGCGRVEAWAFATAVILSVYGKWAWADRLCDVLGENHRRGLKIAAARKAWVLDPIVEVDRSMDEFQ